MNVHQLSSASMQGFCRLIRFYHKLGGLLSGWHVTTMWHPRCRLRPKGARVFAGGIGVLSLVPEALYYTSYARWLWHAFDGGLVKRSYGPFSIQKREGSWPEDVEIQQIVETVGSPVYVYSKATFHDHLSRIQEAYRPLDATVCFSVKACAQRPHPPVPGRVGQRF